MGGAACKWRHALGDAGAKSVPKGDICPFFQAGKCDKGDNCRWSHGPAVMGQVYPPPSFKGKGKGKGGLTFAPVQRVIPQPMVHVPVHMAPPQRQPVYQPLHPMQAMRANSAPAGGICPYFAAGK